MTYETLRSVREAIMCERCIVHYDGNSGTITVSVPTGDGEELELGSFSLADSDEPEFSQQVDEDEGYLSFCCDPETISLLTAEGGEE